MLLNFIVSFIIIKFSETFTLLVLNKNVYYVSVVMLVLMFYIWGVLNSHLKDVDNMFKLLIIFTSIMSVHEIVAISKIKYINIFHYILNIVCIIAFLLGRLKNQNLRNINI